MGFFSWKTQDSGISICNSSSGRQTFPVVMIDDKGNRWIEKDYEGYGEFGGKDFYELLAEMNGLGSDRKLGIELAFSGNPYISPNLVEEYAADYYTWVPDEPECCEFQGFFYPEDYDD